MTLRAHARLFVLVCALLAACATTRDPHMPRDIEGFKLAPYALREECVELAANDRLDYRFNASEPVRFAIQYRESNAVVVPIQRDATREDAGIYPVPESREYCLVWEADAPGARLDYHFRAHPPATR